MSFYGSRYEEIAKTFATLFIKNSGNNKTITLASPSSSVRIDSDGKQGEMTLDSGNQWIALKGQISPDNHCYIYHNGPNKNSDTSKFLLSATTELVEDGKTVNKEVITDGKTILDLTKNNELKMQAVEYDETGHVYFDSSNIKTFKIPKIEVAKTLEELQELVDEAKDDIKELEGQDKDILDDITALNNDVSGLVNSIKSINNLVGARNNMTSSSGTTITGAIGQVANLDGLTIVQAITDQKTKVENLQTDVTGFGSIFGAIQQAITKLEKEAGLEITFPEFAEGG